MFSSAPTHPIASWVISEPFWGQLGAIPSIVQSICHFYPLLRPQTNMFKYILWYMPCMVSLALRRYSRPIRWCIWRRHIYGTNQWSPRRPPVQLNPESAWNHSGANSVPTHQVISWSTREPMQGSTRHQSIQFNYKHCIDNSIPASRRSLCPFVTTQ